MKLKFIRYLFITIPILMISGCFSRWSEEERQDFEKECSQTISFDADPIHFIGFEFEEIDTIRIIERENLKAIDTFYIYPDRVNDFRDKEAKEVSISIRRPLNINNSYVFYLGDDKPYTLDNMEMITWAQYTMMSEGWGCVMGNFTIDNEKFEHVGNINFTKRGFKYKQD